jgi:hypothetical protein
MFQMRFNLLVRSSLIVLFAIYLFSSAKCQFIQNTNIKGLNVYDSTINRVDTFHYSSGKILCISSKKNDRKEGKEVWFYSNGKLWKIYQYKNDSLDGPWIEYYEIGGTMKKYGTYKNGIPIEWKEFYLCNKIKTEGSYFDTEILTTITSNDTIKLCIKDRKKNIKEIKELNNTLIDSIRTEFLLDKSSGIPFPLERNIKNGIWKYWNEDGKLIKEEFFDKGNLINTKTY